METLEAKRCSNYAAGAPWKFRGRALYQLHLVKADVARKIIPKELKLVQAFGYTLGGMYLAHYDDSPAGVFDELVVIAGTVWNPPTSCAWAARVLVNSEDARNHGRKEVGLPSHLASFSKKAQIVDDQKQTKQNPFLRLLPKGTLQMGKCRKVKEKLEVEIFEVNDSAREPFCHINMMGDGNWLNPITHVNKAIDGLVITTVMESKQQRTWMGPSIRMSLPSFSGRTEHQPQLLKYSCNMDCRIRMVEPAQVLVGNTQYSSDIDHNKSDTTYNCKRNLNLMDTTKSDAQDLVISVLISRPILALVFEHMKLHVKAPTIVLPKGKSV
eukprot:Gb_11107 [translate_table: standard]